MTLEERILRIIPVLDLPSDRNELRAIAMDVRKIEDRIKQLDEDLMDAKNQYAVLVADVVLYEDRGEHIKRLEDIIKRASNEFFRDGSDGKAANAMLTILEEVRKP